MPDNDKLYMVTTNGSYNTVLDFLQSESSPGHLYIDTPTQFLAIVGSDGLTNRQRIEATYKTPELKKFIGASIDKMPLFAGTVIYIEIEKVNEADNIVTDGILVLNDDLAFKSAKLAELEADKGYVQVTKSIRGYESFGDLKNSYPNLTVWVWCRGLTQHTTDREMEGEILDITSFIQKITTNVGRNGGNFNITLPPLNCVLENNRWVLNQSNFIQTGSEFMSNDSLFSGVDKNGELQRNQFLFHNVLQSNDVVFIRFESLEMEKEQRYKDAKNFFIDKSMLAGRIYDMVGLIDSNVQTISPESNDVTINITGRDLSKLFLDDGSYFYSFENSQGMTRFAGQSEQKNSLMSRIFSDGSFNFIGLYVNQSIEFIVKFIIQQLSNIKVVPENLFSSYGDRLNTRYNELEDIGQIKNPDYKPQYKKEQARGIWGIFKLIIDNSVTQRRVMDSSFSQANGSLINFLRSAIQEPFVEFFMDTMGDQFYLTVRKPLTDQKSIISTLEGRVNTDDPTQTVQPAIIDIEQIDVLQENLYFDESGIYSWYHFFPKANFFGNATDYSLSYLPAVFFPEYAEIWGSKPFQQCHNYLPYVKLKEKIDGLDPCIQQALEDLRFTIESNQYNPFVRKGTILINGDRRIKIGNLIRYKATGEIFHVDHVQQSYIISERGIDRTTQIFVSRGMVEQLIYGVTLTNEDSQTGGVAVGYFNLIDTTLNYEKITKTETIKEETPRLVRDTIDTVTQQYGYAAPGFCEYMQHQQGYTGARQLADSIQNNTPLSQLTMKRILNNVSSDYLGGADSLSFVKYWLKRYNAAYQQANSLNETSVYEPIFKRVSEETGVPLDVLRTFAQIESNMGQNQSNPNYIGIMQIGQQLASDYKQYNPYDNYGNVKIAALNYLKNSRNNSLKEVLTTLSQNSSLDKAVQKFAPSTAPVNASGYHLEYDVKEKQVTRTSIDPDGIFKNFKVNKFVLNFFLKNLQFSPEFKEVKSRVIIDNNGASLPDFISNPVKTKVKNGK